MRGTGFDSFTTSSNQKEELFLQGSQVCCLATIWFALELQMLKAHF